MRTLAILLATFAYVSCLPAATPTNMGPAAGPSGPAAGSEARTSPRQEPTTPEPLSVGLSISGGSSGVFHVVVEEKLFQKHGLEPSIQFIRPGAPILAALENRDIEVAVTSGPATVAAHLKGAEYVFIGGMLTTHSSLLYVDSSIARIEDLKGKSVAVTQYGSASDVSLRESLVRLGLRPETDVNVVATGGNPASLAALETGSVHGANLSPPFSLEARKKGFKVLVDISSMRIPSPGTMVVTTRSILAERPGALEKVLKAMAEGVAVYRKDKETTVRALARGLQLDDREVLEETYDFYRENWQQDLSPSLAGIQAELDRLAAESPEARTVRPENLVDERLVQGLKRSGFIDGLYR